MDTSSDNQSTRLFEDKTAAKKQTGEHSATPEELTLTKPALLVIKGCLSDRAKKDLRKGYIVIEVSDMASVKWLTPTDINAASQVAKQSVFDYALSQSDSLIAKHELRRWYMFYLRKNGVQ